MMFSSIKSEFRKLVSTRSTYVIGLLSLGLIGLVSGYANGYKASATAAQLPDYLSGQITSAVMVMSVLSALVGLLLVTHEYRHNTIMYTLTASNSRAKTLVAKTVAILVFTVVFTLLVAVVAPLCTYIGLHLRGISLGPQTIDYADVLWRILFYAAGYAMIAMIIAMIIRNQVGAIAVFLIFPSTIEPLLGFLLKEDAKYLPFTSLVNVVNTAPVSGISVMTAVYAATTWIVVGWVTALVLLLRRDAN